MALIIPNATDAGTALRYTNINQSEPDSLDIEVLSNSGNYIRSGGVATQTSGTIAISAGVAVIGGFPYAFSASTFANSVPVNSQFTLAIVRLSGSTAAVTTLNGTDSATNPVFPKSKSTATAAELSANTGNLFDPATDVLLCSVWRAAPASTTDGHIVDKRVVKTGPITWTQTTIPTSDSVSINGDMIVVSTASGPGNALYAKVNGAWLALSTQVTTDDITPIGSIIMWPSNASPPSRYLECNGATVTSTNFPLLAAAWGVTGTFQLPNYTNKVVRGTTGSGSGGVITSGGGADSQTLTAVAEHTHSLNSHTHPVTDHNHTVNSSTTLTGSGGSHVHDIGHNHGTISGLNTQANPTNLVQRLSSTYTDGFVTGQAFGDNTVMRDVGNSYTAVRAAMYVNYIASHDHSFSVTIPALSSVNSGPISTAHTHSVAIDNVTGLSTQAPSNNASGGVTGGGGSSTISTVPAYVNIRYFVRAT